MKLFKLPILYFGLILLLLIILPVQVFAQYGSNAPTSPIVSVTANVCVNNSPNINLAWSGVNQTDSFNIYRYEYAPPPGGDGLTGFYYDNNDFTDFKLTRIDPTINFTWGGGSPDSEIRNDQYSILWSGLIVPKYSETYTFYLTSDDGASLFINNYQVINNWTAQGLTNKSGSLGLTANQIYSISVTYKELSSNAEAHLEWRSSSQIRQIVPKSALYSTSVTGTQIAGNLSQNARSYTDATALPGKLYSYRVVAVNGDGSASSSWTPYQLTQECSRPIIDNNSIINTCSGSPSSPAISFNFADPSPSRTSYNVYRQVQSTGQVTQIAFNLPTSPKSFTDNSASLAPNTTYLYQVGGIDSLGETFSVWSNPVTTIANCSQPVINLFLTSNGVTKPYTDFPPLNIKQKDPVSISWNTTNAVTCTASIPSTNPAPSQALINAWSGNKANSSAGLALPEITSVGDYQFTLTCNNPVGVPNSSTITLTVTQLQKPYIQTTGGDVHTNESITIPRVP